jgi:hypothetical protein
MDRPMKTRIKVMFLDLLTALVGFSILTTVILSCNNKGETVNSLKPNPDGGSRSQADRLAVDSDYFPKFWVEGIYNDREGDNKRSREDIDKAVQNVAGLGWDGILFWGADRDGSKMDYFFRSPFLEKQEWAVAGENRLSPLLYAAHAKGLKVMVNIEGVNPYHWKQNHWTRENIEEVAMDLINDSIDALFEECFEVKPGVFTSLARTLKAGQVDYISGTDPMLLRESHFPVLWPETGIINIYNYYLKRDKIFNIATLAQHGSLGYGWAKYWNKPTSFMSPINRNWGIAEEYSPAVIPYMCMIRALQFRVDNFVLFGGLNKFDPKENRNWIKEYIERQEKDRPLLDIIVLLKEYKTDSDNDPVDPGWNRLFNSGDAITSGALNAGYNIVVSDKVLPADAYWVYTSGGQGEILPQEVVDLFSSDKPVFIQCGSSIPGGANCSVEWRTVLERCGVDGTVDFGYEKDEEEDTSDASLPQNQERDLPYTGYYKDIYLRFTGSDVQHGNDLRSGTVIPDDAIKGTVYCMPNRTYGRGPFIVGMNNKFLVTATSLNWEVSYPVSDLISGCGIKPTSNVWGIAGRNVTALIAIETTELEMRIPGMDDGSNIHVVVWDKRKNKKSDKIVRYEAPFRQILDEYDFILIDRIQ